MRNKAIIIYAGDDMKCVNAELLSLCEDAIDGFFFMSAAEFKQDFDDDPYTKYAVSISVTKLKK